MLETRFFATLYNSPMSHAINDAVSLALAREIAEGLSLHPEWIAFARANISRWRERNLDSPSLLRCYDEWDAILQRPVADVIDILTMETEEGQRLRQSSPFAGVIPYRRVWEIKRAIWDAAKKGRNESDAA